MTLQDDPRWQRFNDSTTPCACCGRSFTGVFDIAFDHPDPWPHGALRTHDGDILAVGDDALSTDLCRLDGQHYFRCILPFPIIGADETFSFGVWGSVSDASFKAYRDSETSPQTNRFDGCFSWLANALPGLTEEILPCDLIPGDDGLRPTLKVHREHTAIASQQSTGITFDQLLDIYAASGTDLRPHLSHA